MGTVKQLLTIARGELGNTESPAGSNRTKYGAWFGKDGYAWCMMFVQWLFAQIGVKLPLRTASCGELMRAAKAAGCWVTRDFRPGDVVIYDFPGGAATDHCGVVEMSLPDYGVQAIEGNTSQSGSQSNGGQVCRKNRPKKYIVGAVRPVFEPEEEEDDMDITKITDEQAYQLLQKAQRHAAALGEPGWSQDEGHWARLTAAGIVNGESPEGLVKRCEVAAMLGRLGLA